MLRKFFPALKNTTSREFRALVRELEQPLLENLRKKLPNVEAVKITGFREGSIIAEYDIIFGPDGPQNVTLISVEEAVLTVVTNSSLNTTFNVDTSYVPTVTGSFAVFNHLL